MKTTKKQYEQFKRSFLHWRDKLGLLQYRIVFRWGADKGNYAQISTDIEFRLALVKFTKDVEDKEDYKDLDPILMGKHECLHLLLAELRYNGMCRYVCREDIEGAEEAIVAVLGNVLGER